MYDPIGSVLGAWSAGDGLWAIAFRLALALTFGAVLGCERAAKRHAAGLRTFVLVCMSGTAAMTLDRASGGLPLISAAVVLGIAIISTNSILFSSKSQIRGLTTATGLWSCSLLGLALGAGLYTLAALGFAAILACLSWLPAFETYLKDRSNHFEVHLELKNKLDLPGFVSTVRALGIRIDDIESNPAYLNSGLSVFTVSFTVSSAELKQYKKHGEIIEALRSLDYVYYIEEMN